MTVKELKTKRAEDVGMEIVFDSKKEERDFKKVVATIIEDLIGDFIDSEPDPVGTPNCLENEIEKVMFNDPATIVFWKDGTKTVSKCKNGDTYNKETGLAMCIIRKLCGNRNYNKVFEKFCNN